MHTTAPTIVLVHGAFADSSSWNGVIERLLDRSIRVVAAPTRCVAHRRRRIRA